MAILIEWLGHACFRITGTDGTKVLIDPYDDSIGYRIPDYSCDILLISHDHFDHAAEQFVPLDHVTIREEGRHEAEGLAFEAKTFPHDEEGGRKRGTTLAFRFDIDGLTFAHLGDIGEIPSPAEMDFLRGVQCLMIPVGGHFTIDAAQATQIVNDIKPAYVFPMHYKTRVLTLPIGNVDDFLKAKSDVERISDRRYTIDPANLPPRPTIVVLDFM
jgi:L-ascorbate metabolism protein UlaG (beta-lactamase superfamily)